MSTLRLCNVDPDALALATCHTVLKNLRALSDLLLVAIEAPVWNEADEAFRFTPLFKFVHDLTVYAKTGESGSEETIPQRLGKFDALYIGPLGYPVAPPPDMELELVISAAQARWLLHTGHRITTAQLATLVSLDRMRIQQMIMDREVSATQHTTGRRGWTISPRSAFKLLATRAAAPR